MKTKIEIKSVLGEVIFTYEEEGATMKRAVEKAVKSDADLYNANLSGANLIDANIDFSCLSFSCKSRKPKTDERQRIQLCIHFLSWIESADNATAEEKEIFNSLVSYANRFHRTDVSKFNRMITETTNK